MTMTMTWVFLSLLQQLVERPARPSGARVCWDGGQRPAAVHDVAVRVAVGKPGLGRALPEPRLGPVADAVGEDGLEPRPLVVGEGDRHGGLPVGHLVEVRATVERL